MTVNAWLIDMPTRVKGHTVKNPDDSYSIFINAKMNYEQRLKAYKHEIEHIQNEDFSSDIVQIIESERH